MRITGRTTFGIRIIGADLFVEKRIYLPGDYVTANNPDFKILKSLEEGAKK